MSGKAKDFLISGASTPITAVAAEPLSITESVAPIPPPKTAAANPFTKKTSAKSEKRSIDAAKKDNAAPNIESGGEKVNPPPTDPTEPPEMITKPQKPGSPTHSSKGSISSSLSSSLKAQQPQKSKTVMNPFGVKVPSTDQQDARSRQLSSSQTPSPRDKGKEDSSSGKKYDREALLEEYHALQKERKSLRKRNLQAQTNIAQYMRKHRYTCSIPPGIC